MFRSTIYKTCIFALTATLLVGAVAAGTARAQDQIGGVPGEWLSRYLGARTAGIGGAFVAVADDALGPVWNPAGLSQLSQNQVGVETAILYESTTINTFSFALPGRTIPSFGLTVLSLGSGDFEKTNELNESLGTFKEGDLAFLLTASKNFTRNFYLGANVKIVRQAVDEFDATGVGVDLGVLYQVHPAVRLGASVLNIGGPSLALREIDEEYPADVRGGVAVNFLSGRALLSGQVDYNSELGAAFSVGTEFWVHNALALRLGFAETDAAGGFSFRITPDAQFDYAATDNVLGVTHRLGIVYRFGGFFASSKADPSVFSPIGERSVTKFHLAAKTKADAGSWTLEIINNSNYTVRRFSGKGAPPAHVMWDGKDEAGLPLPDGTYEYWLVVVDAEGRQMSSHTNKVEITTEGPKGAVPVYTNR
ncbi:MAG: PorV/PorQ family protein [Candidatus Latescibacterota bacterium]|jgi:hypothetical protein